MSRAPGSPEIVIFSLLPGRSSEFGYIDRFLSNSTSMVSDNSNCGCYNQITSFNGYSMVCNVAVGTVGYWKKCFKSCLKRQAAEKINKLLPIISLRHRRIYAKRFIYSPRFCHKRLNIWII